MTWYFQFQFFDVTGQMADVVALGRDRQSAVEVNAVV